MIPLSENERALMTHISRFGSDGYPVHKLGKKWVHGDAFGVRGSPIVFKTKKEAVASFEAWHAMARERYGFEAQQRTLKEIQ